MWPTTRCNRKKQSGFTLIELLTVIAVVGVLLSLLLPAVQAAREAVRRLSCANNVRQISLAALNHETQYRRFPSGIVSAQGKRPFATWLQELLPFVEQQAIYDRATADYRVSVIPFQHRGMQTLIPLFQCPSDMASGSVFMTHYNRIVATTSYIGVNGTNYREKDGVFFLNSVTKTRDITDGLSQTLLVGERPPSPDFWYGWWYAGAGVSQSGAADMLLGVNELNDPRGSFLQSCPTGPYSFVPGDPKDQCATLHYWSFHPGGAQFAFCDGSVRFISFQANLIMSQHATKSGGEVAVLQE